jgi:dTDP-4-amino-4,6-dideoxygalactose transaminase
VSGFNYRMTDLQAAVGREQLKRLPAMLERRRLLAQRYHEQLVDLPGVRVPIEPAFARTNWQSYCVGLPAGCSQKVVMQTMLDEGISTRRGVMCSHREGAYPEGSWRKVGELRHSEEAQDTSIILPLYHDLSEAEQDRVVATLRIAIQRNQQSTVLLAA